MQHAGLQYGQGAVNSHQSPPFAHADISHTNGGNTTSSLRQFRKKDDKISSTDLNTSVESSHIARVPPHNHYPARPNDYLRYQHQYDYNSPYKETPAPVKYSEIAETPEHVDLQKHKDVHKNFMEMCNITQQPHMKQNYPDNLSRQQSYLPDAASVHHQYLHKEPQVHGYKPESQYQQYQQIPKYNMPAQCRKYPPPPPPPENDFLAKLQRINPSMARSIMSDHHIRESHSTYPPSMEQSRMYQNQRYYPQNYNYQPYNYPSSCSYPRTNQMGMGGAQYPTLNPHSDRSISPRNLHMMSYGTSPQKVSPNYSQYNTPEYAQHYQHRRTSLPQEYYQQSCRTNPYIGAHQISPEPTDNRGSSGAIRHFLENWAEEEAASTEITPIFKDNIRAHNETTNESNQQVFVINPSELPQCLENVSLVPTENGQFILKTGALDNSVVRIKETTENNGERTVNLQILEAPEKSDCMVEEGEKTDETLVPYQDNPKDCDETKAAEENEETSETSVIVSNEVSVIKDMPLIDEDAKKEDKQETPVETEENKESEEEITHILEETNITSSTRRTQRIFSVDDIINNIGTSPTESRRNSLQFVPKSTEEREETEENEELEYRNAISVEDDSVILEIGGAWVQLNINQHNGTKILSVLPLSDSLVIDVNGNYQGSRETVVEEGEDKEAAEEPKETEESASEEKEEQLEDDSVFQSEVVIGEESTDNEVFLDLSVEATTELDVKIPEETVEPEEENPPETVAQEAEEVTKEAVVEAALEIEEEETPNEETLKTVVEDPTKIVLEEPAKTVPEDPTTIVSEDLTKIVQEDLTKIVQEDLTKIVQEDPTKTILEEPTKEERENEETTTKLGRKRECRKSKESEEKKKEPEEVRSKVEPERRRENRRRSRDGEDKRKTIKRVRSDERRDSEERPKKKTESVKKKEPELKIEEPARRKHDKEETRKNDGSPKVKKVKSGDEDKKEDCEETRTVPESPKKKQEKKPAKSEEPVKVAKKDKKIEEKTGEESVKSAKREKRSQKEEKIHEAKKTMEEPKKVPEEMEVVEKKEEPFDTTSPPPSPPPPAKVEEAKEVAKTDAPDVVLLAEEMITLKQLEETKDSEKMPTKAAKKLYLSDPPLKEPKPKIEEPKKKSVSKLEETVNKIKSMKEKKVDKPKPKQKKVTFNLEAEVREINDEIDRKRLSLQEYNSRKRRTSSSDFEETKIMEDTVTSTEDDVEAAIKESPVPKSSPKKPVSNWEADTPSPGSPKDEVMSTTNRKCIIDVNEFNIKPIESVSTPSPVSSSQFSYHSEDDSLQVYKDVVDSKLNSLNIKIPMSKPKPVDRFSVLLDRFLNKGTLNYEELEEVKKFIEIKRKMLEEEKQKTYEVKERDYKDLKMHFRKVPEKRKKKRFRNLYAEDTSEDSDSSRSDKGVENYSVYQRDSQGVPKLIFKRKSGLPQPFVKLERSQAVELLAKKRKLY